MARRIERVVTCERFDRDYKRLPDEIKPLVKEALKSLLHDPLPAKLRFHKLGGYSRPSIYTIDITDNHSHKASLELKEGTATLRRLGTHKEIDRAP